MTAKVIRLVRYPVKSVGREDIQSVDLIKGQTMPWDRTWAVGHEQTKADNSQWSRCSNFLRVASSPKLAAINAKFDETTQTLSLTHPERPDISVQPEHAPETLVEWLKPLVADGRAAAAKIVRVPNRGMTDTDFPSVSLANMASHRAVSQKIGSDLSLYRWRSNVWIEGLAPWEEFEWVGKTISIGGAVLKVIEPLARCTNILANPETGHRDHDVLSTLETWGHQNFSMAAEVIQSGTISVDDTVVAE